MAKSKQQKTEALEAAKSKFDSSKLVVLASYNDLPVSDIQELRKQLKEKDVFYKVVKKTILKLVAKDNIDEALVDGIRGNLALAYGPDEVEAAKILAKLVGSLKSPISGFVNVLGGNTRGLVTVLKAIADQKQ